MLLEAGTAFFARGYAAQQDGKNDEAFELYEETLRANPLHVEAHNNIATILTNWRRFDEALIHCSKALDISPAYAPAHSNMAAALVEMERPRDALPYCKRALELLPGNTFALSNLGVALLKCGRFADAEKILREALRERPGNVGMTIDLGLTLLARGEASEALTLFRTVMDSAHPKAHLAKNNAAFMALMSGDYKNGWEWYKARFQTAHVQPRMAQIPEWDGEPDPYGHLVVVAEQGLGDEILYLSMAEDLAARFQGRVTWEIDGRLLHMAETTLFSRNLFFTPRSFMDTPPPEGAGLRIDAGRVGQYMRPSRKAFVNAPTKWLRAGYVNLNGGARRPRVGISWMSKNPVQGARKTVPLAHWAGMITALTQAGIEVMSLQYDEPPGLPASLVPCPFDARKDLTMFAGAVANCDHVVTVSNTTAHLAGALGVKTTVLLSSGMARYWYWGEAGRSDWYPSVEVKRYTDAPDLDAIALDLCARLKQT